MRISPIFTAVLSMLLLAACAAPAFAQTDVALSLYGAFTQKETSDGVIQSPSNHAGVMFELRHIKNPILGFEATYSINRASQTYTSTVAPTCPIGVPNCPPAFTSVLANAHEITVDWVPSIKLLHVRPFGVLGGGVLFHQPASGQDSTKSDTKGVFVYGAGLDWGLVPHIGLRLQYRGNLYQAPNLTELYTSVNKFTHTAEPMIGMYVRF